MNMAVPDSAKSKLIPVVLDESTNRCPYIGWYRFKECNITTCKNFTTKTASRCLGIDRKAPSGNKVISDAELHLFKFPEDDVSTRLVSMRRKRAITKVKCILSLNGYLNHLRMKYEGTAEQSREYRAPAIGVAESSYPLKIGRLRFKNWMWKLLLSEKEYAAFAQSGGGGECLEFELHDLLSMTKEQLGVLRQVVASVSVPARG